MLDESIQLHRGGRLDEAEQGYRAWLAGHPDDAKALHLLGILRGQRGDIANALQLVSRASELDPENAACRHTLGEMYLSERRLDDAASAFEQSRVLNPNLAAAHAGLGHVALLRGEIDAAESHFKVALRADENDAQALTGLGSVAQARGDSARALQWFAQAAEQAPDDPRIQAGHAQALLDQGMLDFAAQAIDNALTVKPDYPLVQALRADVHVRKGELAAALPIFESLLARGQQVGAVRTGLGDIALAQKKYDEAIAQYDEALRDQPDLHHAATRRADALARSGRIDQAIDDLRWHVASHPGGVKAHIGLAQMLTQTGRYDEAIAVWNMAETRWPEDVNVRAQHALTLDRAGRTEEANTKADQAAASPRPALALLRARNALLAGDPATAVQRLQRIDSERLAGKPRLLTRRREWMLGLAFDGLEQWADAAAAFMRAQALVPASPPELVALDDPTRSEVIARAAEPPLAEPRTVTPILLCGLPGSGAARVAALLADQPGCFLRRDRFETAPDFISAPFAPRLAEPLDQAALGLLARRYERALARTGMPAGAQLIDWIPVLDARLLSPLKRALPGVRLLLVAREPHDMLLNWLAFGSAARFAMPSPLAGARWLRLADAHLELAASLLPALHVDPDDLFGSNAGPARAALATFMGLPELADGPLANAAATRRGGLPAAFPAGHAAHYHESLAEAFAALDALQDGQELVRE